ncbi:MAG: hypothetical protein WCI92_18080 [Bacteroidota bacterium]
MQEKVNKWIENGCSFDEGVAILASISKHRALAKAIGNRPHRYSEKLRYELLKYAGTQNDITVIGKTDIPTNLDISASEKPRSFKEGQLPPEVEKAIKFHSDAFKQRAILHEAMANLPDKNTPELIAEREDLSNQIAECSEVIEIMWKANEEYKVNGTLPDVDAIVARLNAKAEKPSLPETENELNELKLNIQKSISADRFMLDYQQKTKGKNKNPLPPGPKRTKTELRIKQKEKDLTNIEIKLASLPK